MEKLNKLIATAVAEVAPKPEIHEGNKALEALAHEVIQRRLAKLGLGNHSSAGISYCDNPGEEIIAHFNGVTRDVIVSDIVEADIHIVIHELLHSYADYYSREGVGISQAVPEEPRARLFKSGFNSLWSTWRFDEDGEEILYKVFTDINEAITEKLAGELALEVNAEYSALEPLFAGREEEVLGKVDHDYHAVKLPQARAKDFVSFGTFLEARVQIDNDYLIFLLNMLEEYRMMGNDGKVKEIEDEIERVTAERDVHSNDPTFKVHEGLVTNAYNVERDLIKNAYAFSADNLELSYAWERPILEKFIKYHVIVLIKENPDLEWQECLDQAWEEVQIAYFKGNVFFLKKFDRYFGKGTLQALQDYSGLPMEEKVRMNNEMLEQLKRFAGSE